MNNVVVVSQSPDKIKVIANKFGSIGIPKLLDGGQGTTYRSGEIILKPVGFLAESKEAAEIVSGLTESPLLNLPKAVKSINGNWVEDGYVAWNFVPGTERQGYYSEKLKVCDYFGDIFGGLGKPKFLDLKNDEYTIADRVAWGELERIYPPEQQEIIDLVKSKIRPVNLPSQIIHGDISGNMVFTESGLPGVIDLTLYWRPRNFTKAILLIDAITWEDADPDIYDLVSNEPEIDQLLIRAALRRIVTGFEFVKSARRVDRNWETVFEQAQKYINTLRVLKLL
jgi:uncharacterized protein (TIGR02569 family)